MKQKIVVDAESQALLGGQFHERVALDRAEPHRLLDEHALAGFEKPAADALVRKRRHQDVNDVAVRVEQPVERVVDLRDAVFGRRAGRPLHRHIADGADLDLREGRQGLGVSLNDVSGAEQTDLQSDHARHLGTSALGNGDGITCIR